MFYFVSVLFSHNEGVLPLLTLGAHAQRGLQSVGLCMCLWGDRGERKGNGRERKVTKHNKTRGLETFVNFTTRGSSVVKITCIF